MSVQIVVAVPNGPARHDLTSALERLGPDVRTLRVAGVDACVEGCRGGGADLVIVDASLECERLLDALREDGPPVVVAGLDPERDAALPLFRRGAADCVAAGPELAETLALVALEQVRRVREARELAALHSQVQQSEKMASLGQLAAGIAHEINNPMGFVHANLFQMAEYVADLRQLWKRVEELQRQVAAGDPEAVRGASAQLAEASAETDVDFVLGDLEKAIRESQEGSERIRHIVQDLREFSHGETGELVETDVTQCLDSTATIVWPMMKHLVELERDYADVAPVRAYPMQLKQVFTNLLVNAYQAIEERVGVSGEIGHVRLAIEPVEGGVRIEVHDDGRGIPPELQRRIFDPFFTTKKVGAGTGLGLSTSFNIVKRHGGSIEVSSGESEGTVFRVFLPARGPDGG